MVWRTRLQNITVKILYTINNNLYDNNEEHFNEQRLDQVKLS